MMIRPTPLALAAALLSSPAVAQEVNIYSYRQPELIQPILDGFTKATGIETNAAYINQGLTERLVAEGDRSPADIILTVDISRLTQAKEAGVTQPVSSDALSAHIPAAMRDAEGHWFGVTYRGRIVYAAKDRVAPGEITTYEALADPEWKGRICTRSGTHSYTLGLVAAMIAHHGYDATKEWAQGIKDNLARPPAGDDRAQVRAIWAGECDISLGNTYYMGAMLDDPEQAEWANAVRIEFPVFEDTDTTHVNISGVAMTRAAPHPEAARAFMDYLASPEAQKIYAEVVHEYPADPDTPASDLVASWGEIRPDETDLPEIAANRDDALRLMQEIDFDG
ncbi:Fe(3+) ABC transporter substrate-binding protein [Mesobaculum littorinae]|uniref:Fe(3+) ABC transporter substrate-binding protein n=1 Tax=Mesobaculum littorinae TaxID=2486419 RepID=A0A438AKH2_9RHOB|nr:Fe(3+) ABC transporter substrate-binding protein [Mesobaculum littorinae]RVV99321.1 Fe(3+) ABC transporter substrate-binding protein [Mesobaculum littorinae]